MESLLLDPWRPEMIGAISRLGHTSGYYTPCNAADFRGNNGRQEAFGLMKMEASQVQAIVGLAKAGRAEGFQTLLAAYGPRLFGYFYRITANRHESEDLLAEVMLRLVRTLERYDERGKFEPWLFRIAANLVRDRLRRKALAPVQANSGAGEGPDLVDGAASREPPPPQRLLDQEQRHELMAALADLDEPTRQTIVLRHFSGMSFAQIADLMACPVGTALARVHRGLRTLRCKLEAPPKRSQKQVTYEPKA
jgi:RNA polymerase sigma-70 factor, ECF subfamily